MTLLRFITEIFTFPLSYNYWPEEDKSPWWPDNCKTIKSRCPGELNTKLSLQLFSLLYWKVELLLFRARPHYVRSHLCTQCKWKENNLEWAWEGGLPSINLCASSEPGEMARKKWDSDTHREKYSNKKKHKDIFDMHADYKHESQKQLKIVRKLVWK